LQNERERERERNVEKMFLFVESLFPKYQKLEGSKATIKLQQGPGESPLANVD